MKRFIQITT